MHLLVCSLLGRLKVQTEVIGYNTQRPPKKTLTIEFV